jgi:hypothetical protein
VGDEEVKTKREKEKEMWGVEAMVSQRKSCITNMGTTSLISINPSLEIRLIFIQA